MQPSRRSGGVTDEHGKKYLRELIDDFVRNQEIRVAREGLAAAVQRIRSEGMKPGVWICSDCGNKYGRHPEGHLSTWTIDQTCDYCKEVKTCTEPRDFGYPLLPKKIKEVKE